MEDYPFNSSPPLSTKPVVHSKATSQEESGWTAYFQDFSDHQEQEQEQEQHEEQSLCSSFGATSSMVSDAASHAAWRISRGCHNHVVGATGDFGTPKSPVQLSFKKTRTKQISAYDDSLEDTASSPVNSPKIGDLRQNIDHMSPRRNTFDQHTYISMRKGGISENSEVHSDEEERRINMGLNNNNGKKETCIDLKKRGLCLVPMSMLVNYLG